MSLQFDVALEGGRVLKVTFDRFPVHVQVSSRASLRFLSLVEISRLPLHIVLGPPFQVLTEHPETQEWLHQTLRDHSFPGSNWRERPGSESPLGVLLGLVDTVSGTHESSPRVTEILVYATSKPKVLNAPPTPPTTGDHHAVHHDSLPAAQLLDLNAIALSSDLLYRCEDEQNTPPLSPRCGDGGVDAVFLAPCLTPTTEVVHEPPVKRRRTAADAFEEANERRRQFRRQGHALSMASSVQEPREPNLQSIRHRRLTSSNADAIPTSRAHSHSRSPSIVSAKPSQPVQQKSALSRAQSVSYVDQEQNAVEIGNKELISRIVMAGMRLHGFTQRRSSRHASRDEHLSMAEIEAARKEDEEFKLIYHQVYKGVCFAFRAKTSIQPLSPHSDAVREIVDRFLAIFCSDPLAAVSCAQHSSTQLTPGGRTPFGQSVAAGGDQGYFAAAPD